jgi:hypothetical protein
MPVWQWNKEVNYDKKSIDVKIHRQTDKIKER